MGDFERNLFLKFPDMMKKFKTPALNFKLVLDISAKKVYNIICILHQYACP